MAYFGTILPVHVRRHLSTELDSNTSGAASCRENIIHGCFHFQRCSHSDPQLLSALSSFNLDHPHITVSMFLLGSKGKPGKGESIEKAEQVEKSLIIVKLSFLFGHDYNDYLWSCLS